MIDESLRPALDAAVERLRAFAPVERVILFGSRARGDHDEESDWDLCVILNDDIPPGVYTPGAMWQAMRTRPDDPGGSDAQERLRSHAWRYQRLGVRHRAGWRRRFRCGDETAVTGGASDPWEWVRKARQDARSARRLLTAPPEWEVAAYHRQQAVEKAIKALLTAEGIKYPRGRGAGHDLDALAGLIPATNPRRSQALSLSNLTPWATVFRYPADDPMTAQPLPAEDEIRGRLGDVEIFIVGAARQFERASPGGSRCS